MKLIYAQGFSKNEKLEWKPVVFNNVVQSMRLIFDVMSDQGIDFENKDNEVRTIPTTSFDSIIPNPIQGPFSVYANWATCRRADQTTTKQKNQAVIQADHEISPNDNLPEAYLEPIKSLWADGGVQKAILKGNEYALHDNLS